MENVLKSHLDKYYDSLIEYKHIASRTNAVLFKDLERYISEDSILHLTSALILKDWSGETDNGWSYSYPTDSVIYTTKENYTTFINDLISKQFCLMYVQSFEGLERLLKNLLFELSFVDIKLKSAIEYKLKKNQKFSRNNMPSGDILLEILDELLDLFLYGKENIQFDLKTSFFILSKTRNSIVHNNYTSSKSQIFCSVDKKNLFVDLFMYEETDDKNIKIKLDIICFRKLIDFICEFSFQVFKKLCLKYDINWKVYKNMD